MYWEIIYVILAENLSLSVIDQPNAKFYMDNCIEALVSLESDNDGSLIERTFTRELWMLYAYWTRDLFWHEKRSLYLSGKINDFTVAHYGGDLTSFVNGLNWTDGCIPSQWQEWTEIGGYDTSEWDLCS